MISVMTTFHTSEDRVVAPQISPAEIERQDLVAKIAKVVQEQSLCSDLEAMAEAQFITDPNSVLSYEKWRHGGWTVTGVRYPSGACGCVSSNYKDGKWRIVCDDRRVALGEDGDFTFPTREKAARAEQALTLDAWREHCDPKDQEPVTPDRPRGG